MLITEKLELFQGKYMTTVKGAGADFPRYAICSEYVHSKSCVDRHTKITAHITNGAPRKRGQVSKITALDGAMVVVDGEVKLIYHAAASMLSEFKAPTEEEPLYVWFTRGWESKQC